MFFAGARRLKYWRCAQSVVKSQSAVCRKQSPGRQVGDCHQLGQRAFERNIINQNIRSGQRTNIQLKGHKERYYLDFDGHIG